LISNLWQAWSLHEKNMLIDLVDQKLNNTIVEIELQRVIKVALLCVQQDPRRRPLMSRVLLMLQGEMEIEVIFGEFELQTNIYEKHQASLMDGSTSESSRLLLQPMPNKYNHSNAEIEFTIFDPR
jgi:hypothetical protein